MSSIPASPESANAPITHLSDGGDVIAYTVPEAASKARVSRALLYKHIGEGRLTARKLGARTIVLRADLVAYLEGAPRVSSPGLSEA